MRLELGTTEIHNCRSDYFITLWQAAQLDALSDTVLGDLHRLPGHLCIGLNNNVMPTFA
jgi:hypothetical protein